MLVEAARAVGLRSILSQGWANLTPSDTGNDCLAIGDVNYENLFSRVAAIVHHGGSGTTQAAARAGSAQVIIPHNYDQFYWSHRVQQLGVGVSGPLRDELSVDALIQALHECLRPEVTTRAQALTSSKVQKSPSAVLPQTKFKNLVCHLPDSGVFLREHHLMTNAGALLEVKYVT